jgi:hypothetical protein
MPAICYPFPNEDDLIDKPPPEQLSHETVAALWRGSPLDSGEARKFHPDLDDVAFNTRFLITPVALDGAAVGHVRKHRKAERWVAYAPSAPFPTLGIFATRNDAVSAVVDAARRFER